MAVAFTEFGSNDVQLYQSYLKTFEHVRDTLKYGDGVRNVTSGALSRALTYYGRIGCGIAGVSTNCDVGSVVDVSGKSLHVGEVSIGCGGIDNSSSIHGINSDNSGNRFDSDPGDARDRNSVRVTVEDDDDKLNPNVGLGLNTLRNRQWRKEKRDRKVRRKAIQYVGHHDVPEWRKGSNFEDSRFSSDIGLEERKKLNVSRAKRFEAENQLHQARAERALELLRSSDIDKEKKMREVRVMRDTELSKVKVEQAFAKLANSGNVPGFAETVVSGTPTLASGSISPNSSISAAEVHAMQKELLELQRRDTKISQHYKKIDPIGFAKLLKQCEGTVDTSFTADTEGHETAQYGGYHLGEDGRYHSGENFDYY